MSYEEYCITAKDVYNLILEKHPDKQNELKTEEIAIIVFPKSTIAHLEKTGNLEERNWLMNTYSFYAYPTLMWKGNYKGTFFNVVQPPMGDTGTAAVIEQLIACGTKTILLVCGAWGIRNTLQIGDICIPEVSKAQNKIASSYGASDEIQIDRSMIDIIFNQLERLGIKYSHGTNYAFESFYRIPRNELEKIRNEMTLTAENGELHTLLSIGKEFGIRTGAIFYNYFMPLRKQNLDTPSELYIKGGQTIGEIALNVIACK